MIPQCRSSGTRYRGVAPLLSDVLAVGCAQRCLISRFWSAPTQYHNLTIAAVYHGQHQHGKITLTMAAVYHGQHGDV